MTPRWAVPALAAAGLVAAGWWIGVRVHRRRCEEQAARVQLLVAVANQRHALCKVTENAMANYIAHQERELDTLRAGVAVVDEAERITREGS